MRDGQEPVGPNLGDPGLPPIIRPTSPQSETGSEYSSVTSSFGSEPFSGDLPSLASEEGLPTTVPEPTVGPVIIPGPGDPGVITQPVPGPTSPNFPPLDQIYDLFKPPESVPSAPVNNVAVEKNSENLVNFRNITAFGGLNWITSRGLNLLMIQWEKIKKEPFKPPRVKFKKKKLSLKQLGSLLKQEYDMYTVSAYKIGQLAGPVSIPKTGTFPVVSRQASGYARPLFRGAQMALKIEAGTQRLNKNLIRSGRQKGFRVTTEPLLEDAFLGAGLYIWAVRDINGLYHIYLGKAGGIRPSGKVIASSPATRVSTEINEIQLDIQDDPPGDRADNAAMRAVFDNIRENLGIDRPRFKLPRRQFLRTRFFGIWEGEEEPTKDEVEAMETRFLFELIRRGKIGGFALHEIFGEDFMPAGSPFVVTNKMQLPLLMTAIIDISGRAPGTTLVTDLIALPPNLVQAITVKANCEIMYRQKTLDQILAEFQSNQNP